AVRRQPAVPVHVLSRDGAYDLFENLNGNFGLDPGEDMDRDGRLTPDGGCEGAQHEDFNCNGQLDQEIDRNFNGKVDPNEDTGIRCTITGLCPDGVIPGTRGNGKFDTEDKNGNGVLDTVGNSGNVSFPF